MITDGIWLNFHVSSVRKGKLIVRFCYPTALVAALGVTVLDSFRVPHTPTFNTYHIFAAEYVILWMNVAMDTAIAVRSPIHGRCRHCANCGYPVETTTNAPVQASPPTLVRCPECGADLRADNAVVRGRRMSHQAASRLWWFTGAVWAISTGVWIARVLW